MLLLFSALIDPQQQASEQQQAMADGGTEITSELRTLFVAGLPADVKPREVHNLFCRHIGFRSSVLEFTENNEAVAYVTFSTERYAEITMRALNGFYFDFDTDKALFILLAGSNCDNTAPDCGYYYYPVIDKRIRMEDKEFLEDIWTESDLDGRSGMENRENRSEDDYPDSNLEVSTEKSTETESWMTNDGHSFHEKSEVQPCTRLIIVILDRDFSEKELNEALSEYPRFQSLQCHRRTEGGWAFADFEDIESSTEALNELHGTYLPSSLDSPMHVAYARSKLWPCTSLCITSDTFFREKELNDVLLKYPGFKKVKFLRRTRGGMLAFAEFEDIGASTEALNGLYGTYLPSSDHYPLDVEYARSKLRPCTSLCITSDTFFREKELNDVLLKFCFKVVVTGDPFTMDIQPPFRWYPGFKKVRFLKRTRGRNLAFAEFEDIGASTEALNGLYGTYLPSSGHYPLHVEYVLSKTQPCRTLCISNDRTSFDEEELNEALLKYPRFRTLRCASNIRGGLAFAEFEDIEASTEALDGLHGTYLPSSALHVEYARS